MDRKRIDRRRAGPWAWMLACAHLLPWSGPAAARGVDTILPGKTKNGCAYEALYDGPLDRALKGQMKKQAQAAFRRQTWDGACVNGKLHGFGTLRDTVTSKKDTAPLTYEGVLFVNGQHLWAPRITTNLDNYALLNSTIGYRPEREHLIGFFDAAYTGFGHFYNTLDDGDIEPAEVYTRRSVYLHPMVYFRQGYTFRGRRADWIHIWARDSYCNGLSYCIEVGDQKIQCESDCRAEWNEASASGMAVLGKYLDEQMPLLEAKAQAGGVDISGVKAMLDPFVTRAESLRVWDLARRKAIAEAAAASARKTALQTANQSGRVVENPSLDKLLKQSLGARP
jgi:hypothetical protein